MALKTLSRRHGRISSPYGLNDNEYRLDSRNDMLYKAIRQREELHGFTSLGLGPLEILNYLSVADDRAIASNLIFPIRFNKPDLI